MDGHGFAIRRLKVFLASPSDTGPEREAARSSVGRINESIAHEGVQFDIVGWESTPGTAHRPQSALNALVNQCDFLVCILKSKWGSDPGGGVYSSGTEEELFTALIGLSDPLHPMRDVWLVFLDGKDTSMAPEIDVLRDRIVVRNALFYEKAANLAQFTVALEMRLRAWASDVSEKEARKVPLTPMSERDVIGANYHHQQAVLASSVGQLKKAEEEFQKALTEGGYQERLAYAEFLGRQSRVEEALKLVDATLSAFFEKPVLRPIELAKALARQATLRRRTGDLAGSEVSLRSALEHVSGKSRSTGEIRARIYDELGVVLHQQGLGFFKSGDQDHALGLIKASRSSLEKSLEEREVLRDQAAIAQSKINLCRVHVALHDYEHAIEYAEDAVRGLELLGGGVALANAYLARAQALLASSYASNYRDNSADTELQTLILRALDSAKKSAAWNLQLKNERGEAMAHNVTAQLYQRVKDTAAAREYAIKCVELNSKLGLNSPPAIREMLGDL